MRSDQEFRGFYDTALLPTLTVLEKERKTLVNKIYLYVFIALLIAIPFFFILLPLAVVGFIVMAIIYYFKYWKRIKEKQERYKSEVVGRMISFIDPSLTYNHNQCINQGMYHQSKLFMQNINKYKGDDLVSGTMGKTKITFCELLTQLETTTTDSKGNKSKSVTTIFRGIFFMADFNKKFNGETFVLPDVAEGWLGSVGTMLQKMNMVRPQLVKLEDVEFEKEFAVYGTDQTEARYILSTALMQRIMAFRKATRKRISVSFINSQIFVAIPLSENMFEAPLFTSMINFEKVSEYYNYLALCVGIVEVLDLNTRIWTKE
jgi:hypothetical protein